MNLFFAVSRAGSPSQAIGAEKRTTTIKAWLCSPGLYLAFWRKPDMFAGIESPIRAVR